METVESILKSLDTGLWCTSLDLKDAFFHIPVRESHRRYLLFKVGHRHFQSRALPFGLMSPFVFTGVVKAVGAFAHSQGVRLTQYLDAWLLSGASSYEAAKQTIWLPSLVRDLGLVVVLEKSDLIPAQTFQFVGISFDLAVGLAVPAPPTGSKRGSP